MKKIGIICEYNPFHNGHLYHLNKIKEMFNDSLIILIMSGNFTQRGDFSLLDKWTKTSIALNNNIDLIIELPYSFATQSSDFFAEGALKILNEFKIDYLIFGSESNNITELKAIANKQIIEEQNNSLIKKELKKGTNYPTSLTLALGKEYSFLDNPNNILGISYIKQIIKNDYNIIPMTIKRTNDFHEIKPVSTIASASSIRNLLIEQKDIKSYVPIQVYSCLLENYNLFDNYWTILKYKILSEKNLNIFHLMEEGIENRIYASALKSNNLKELIDNIKTKRYTYNRICRTLLNILCNYTKDEHRFYTQNIYIRVLGFNEQGRLYLNETKKYITIPIITNYSKDNSLLLELDKKLDYIYYLFNSQKITDYFKQKPIYKK